MKKGISNNLDGTEDDLLSALSDDSDDDSFAGFDTPTAGDQDEDQQLTESVWMELDALNEWSHPLSEANEPDESDYSDPGSPRN